MKISLRTRPFIQLQEGNYAANLWQERGVVTQQQAMEMLEGIDWQKEIRQLAQSVLNEPEVHIYSILEPGFNLHNETNETELYVGFYENDYLEVSLAGTQEKDCQINGLSIRQLPKVLALFYAQNYDAIQSLSCPVISTWSETKSILEKRYDLRVRKKRRHAWIKLTLLMLAYAMLYFGAKFIRYT